MLSSGGSEPDTWTWTPSDGSTTSGEVPALPMPSPVDGSGRSRSNGAGRHRDQPPLVRNRTRIFGGRTPSRHVKPTIVTSAVSRAGVCQRSVPVLASPRSESCFSRIPTPEVASVWSSSRPSPLPSSELRARRIPAPVPVTTPAPRTVTVAARSTCRRRGRGAPESSSEVTSVSPATHHITSGQPFSVARAADDLRQSGHAGCGIAVPFWHGCRPPAPRGAVERPVRPLARAPQRAAVRRARRAAGVDRGHLGDVLRLRAGCRRPLSPPLRSSGTP